MDTLALVARVLLAIVFATAGSAKLLDLQSSRDTVEAFGLRPSFARLIGTALPFLELACAGALLVQPSCRWAAAAAVTLLVVFSGGVAVALSQGRTPDCNCFGVVSSEAISWRTLARNGVFAAVGVFALAAGPGSSLTGWTQNLTAANLLAGILFLCAALATVAAVSLRLRNKALAVALTDAISRSGPRELTTGSTAPDFALPDLTGGELTLGDLRGRGRPVLLVFASPTCGPWQLLLPQLSRWSATLTGSLTIAVIESGTPGPEAVVDQFESPGEMAVLIEEGFAVPEAYGISQTPTAVLIDPDGTIKTGATTGPSSIERLVRSALRQQPAPEFA
jgi:uncharacterized membrane protein YphA (DoxX/SURF4 family)